jgi:hypothetical protein
MVISNKITRHFQIAFVTITFLMWEKPYISIFVEIGALQNFTHFGGHLKNGCQNDRHFEIFICWPIDFKLTHKHYIRNL